LPAKFSFGEYMLYTANYAHVKPMVMKDV